MYLENRKNSLCGRYVGNTIFFFKTGHFGSFWVIKNCVAHTPTQPIFPVLQIHKSFSTSPIKSEFKMIRGGAKTDRSVREKEKQTHGRVQEQTAKLTEEVCSTVRQLAVGNQGNRVVLEIVLCE